MERRDEDEPTQSRGNTKATSSQLFLGKPRACLEDLGAPFVVVTMNFSSEEASLNFLQPLGLRFQEHMATELQKGKTACSAEQ